MNPRIRKTEDVIATVVLVVLALMLLAMSASIGAQRQQIGELHDRITVLESAERGE